jgi:hypothetical protein
MSDFLADSFLLFGAGASYEADVPVANQFADCIRTYLSTLPAETAQPLLAAFEAVITSIEAAGKEPGLEPIYEAVDDCLDEYFGGETKTGELQPSRAMERLLYEIKRVIQQQCDVRDPKRTVYLEGLWPLLKRLGPYPIVSFNYDTVVETACAAAGLAVREAILGECADAGDIELVKVHGSLTWFPDRGKKYGLVRNPRHADGMMRKLGELRSSTLETPMIYPSRRKMPIHEPFMRNALRLQELLRTKARCVAVGYSFPDLHVRSWIATALRERDDFMLYIVDPNPERAALDNLTRNLPTLPWRERLRVIPLGFGAMIEKGFEQSLAEAKPLDEIADYPKSRLNFVQTMTPLSPLRASGIAAAPDGNSLFVSETAADGGIVRIDLDTGQQTVFADKLKSPRGLAVRPDGRVLVVQNQLFRGKRIAGTGAGSVAEIAADGRRRKVLTRFSFSEIAAAAMLLLKGQSWSNIRDSLHSLLSWPTDVVCTADGTVYATEARALVRIAPDTVPDRISRPAMAFNLHGIDVAADGALVGVEQGIGQDFSWGRVVRFEWTPEGLRYSFSSAAEGRSRLMAICFVPSRNQVVVSQTLSWPHGGLLVLDYPGLETGRFLAGFNFPQKLEYVPNRDVLAVGTRDGLVLLPVSELDRAR